MSQEQSESKDAANSCCEGFPGSFSSRGGRMEEMMRACPCATVMRRHRFAVFATLAMIGLAFLVLQTGWILGVVAFFRTI